MTRHYRMPTIGMPKYHMAAFSWASSETFLDENLLNVTGFNLGKLGHTISGKLQIAMDFYLRRGDHVAFRLIDRDGKFVINKALNVRLDGSFDVGECLLDGVAVIGNT